MKRSYTVTPPNKRLLALLQNYIAREKFVLAEMEAKRVVDKTWHNMNQRCFIKGMEFTLKMLSDPKEYDQVWTPDGKLLLAKSKSYKV